MGTNFKSNTVVQLRELLKKNGLATTGKKAELVARLEEWEASQVGEAAEEEQQDEAAGEGDAAADEQPAIEQPAETQDTVEPPPAADNEKQTPANEPPAAEEPEPVAVEEDQEAPGTGRRSSKRGRQSAAKKRAESRPEPATTPSPEAPEVEAPKVDAPVVPETEPEPATAKPEKGTEPEAAPAVEPPAGDDVDGGEEPLDYGDGGEEEEPAAQMEEDSNAPAAEEQAATTAEGKDAEAAQRDDKKRKHEAIPLYKPRGRRSSGGEEAEEPPAKQPKPDTQPDAAAADEPKPAATPSSAGTAKGKPSAAAAAAPERQRSVPEGPPSAALRIDKFVRPFIAPAARAMLEGYGKVADFWMPTIKTHCYVIFEDEAAATAALEATDGLEWPEGNRTKLQPKYVGVEEARDAIAVGRGEKQAAVPAAAAPASAPVAAEGNDARGEAEKARTAAPKDNPGRKEDVRAKPPPRQEPETLTLDDLFRKTVVKPPIYWLPLTDRQVADKRRRAAGGEGRPNGRSSAR